MVKNDALRVNYVKRFVLRWQLRLTLNQGLMVHDVRLNMK